MTTVLHLPPRPDTPIACDMSAARDTPEERLAEYRELFGRALLGRERRADAVVLTFSADAREQVEDLARREHACCPFVDYRVEVAGDRVLWTTTNTLHSEERAAVDVILDALHDLPDHAGSDIDGYLARLAARGVDRPDGDTAAADAVAHDGSPAVYSSRPISCSSSS
jgi:hypothetical protein